MLESMEEEDIHCVREIKQTTSSFHFCPISFIFLNEFISLK